MPSDPSPPFANPFRARHSGAYAFTFVAIVFVMAALLVAWNANHRIDAFNENQQRTAATAVQSASNEIELLVSEKRRLVKLFAEQHAADIAAVAAAAADDDGPQERLEQRVDTYFPTHFAYTIADRDGASLLADFDGLVGDVCQTDIRTFASHDNLNDLFVHPHPQGYHFDIMAPWSTTRPAPGPDPAGILSAAPARGIFFVSFGLQGISRLLRHSETDHHTLMLIQRDALELVEVDAVGGRNQMTRPTHLTLDELSSIAVRRQVPGTRWDLVAVPDAAAMAAYARSVKWETAGIMVLFLMISGVMLYLVGQAEHHRLKADTALLDTNQHLNNTVRNLQETQQQLIEAEKLAALGSLVKGVAHEINTPIGVGVTAATHLQEEVSKLQRDVKGEQLTRSRLAQFIETAQLANQMVVANLTRAAELITSFKQVATDQVDEVYREFDLQSYLDEIQVSLRPQLADSGHHLDIKCSPGIAMDGYPGLLAQVVTHLVTNAQEHAFPNRSDGLVTLNCQRNRHRVRLDCRDNGIGMAPEVLGRAFDPFVTTGRAQGRVGLGLHIVFNLVTGPLGGRITCDSSPGHGTTFHIDLPLKAPRRQTTDHGATQGKSEASRA